MQQGYKFIQKDKNKNRRGELIMRRELAPTDIRCNMSTQK